jgi:CMP-N-acetylneuraminic acid synthetase
MNTLGVILARAGSQGLANKHLLPLLDRSVVGHTFNHVRDSQRLTKIVVSTDCPQIRLLAQSEGFEVIQRPAELATSEASVQSVMLHALWTIESRMSFCADALAVIYGNVPVRPVGVIDRAIQMLEETRCDSVRSFCPVGKWHPAWMSRLQGDRVQSLQPGSIHRRQDLEPVYLHDGAIVVVSRESMLRGEVHPEDPHAFFGLDRRGFVVGAGETVEIDQKRDLYWAEAVLREQRAAAGLRMAS